MAYDHSMSKNFVFSSEPIKLGGIDAEYTRVKFSDVPRFIAFVVDKYEHFENPKKAGTYLYKMYLTSGDPTSGHGLIKLTCWMPKGLITQLEESGDDPENTDLAAIRIDRDMKKQLDVLRVSWKTPSRNIR